MFGYRKKILELLIKGYNPFEDNTELFQKHKNKEKNKKSGIVDTNPKNQKTIEEAFEFALLIKKKIVGTRTYSGYASKTRFCRI